MMVLLFCALPPRYIVIKRSHEWWWWGATYSWFETSRPITASCMILFYMQNSLLYCSPAKLMNANALDALKPSCSVNIAQSSQMDEAFPFLPHLHRTLHFPSCKILLLSPIGVSTPSHQRLDGERIWL